MEKFSSIKYFILHRTSRKSHNEPIDHDLEVHKRKEVQIVSMLHKFWASADAKMSHEELSN